MNRAKLLDFLQRFKSNHRGFIWVWAVCIMSICVYSICWFSLGWAAMAVIDQMLLMYSFPPQAQLIIAVIKQVICWHPILFIFGMLLWAYVNSQRVDPITYPY
jgi:hypothetical protein